MERLHIFLNKIEVKKMKKYQHFSIVDQNIQIPQTTLNKDEFFSQKFIWMSSSFQKEILSEIENTITPVDYTLTSLTLNQSLSDINIRKDLGEDEVVTPHQWAQELCALMNEQSAGQSGSLLTNGYANVRYVKLANGTILAVDVRWAADGRQWRCNAWLLDARAWYGDRRFFVRS